MQRPRQSKKRQSELSSDMATDFDAVPLHNLVHDVVSEDDQLARLLDAAALADEAGDVRRDALGEDAELVDDVRDAWGKLSDAARERALEAVAEACATIIQDGDDWVEDGHCAQDEMDSAKHEARNWLQTHTNEASRVGVLEEVSL